MSHPAPDGSRMARRATTGGRAVRVSAAFPSMSSEVRDPARIAATLDVCDFMLAGAGHERRVAGLVGTTSASEGVTTADRPKAYKEHYSWRALAGREEAR
ncbi:hypothetical protein D8771_05505 [Streptomyces albus]|uniref:Uncharacterized protein n=1 Tax=Streptomyces albus TaxID=1888 RepID=A0A8H1LPB2_9ACTN|nr:hypothetical protein ADL27_49140 [Streptomyces sp. NRRL F-6602]TGG86818.1 hypothetical protein D8771_05505 [Streptomyces albus]